MAIGYIRSANKKAKVASLTKLPKLSIYSFLNLNCVLQIQNCENAMCIEQSK